MKIISFSAIKGGVGKTTLTYNYGEWLASRGYNVLLIDSDHQGSLTQTYDKYLNKGTIEAIFTEGTDCVEIQSIHKNLDLIVSSFYLDKINSDLQNKENRSYLMFLWLQDHLDDMLKYDFILIDCHPDFSTITKNMLLVSDYIFSPIEPSEYGFTSKDNLKIRLEEFGTEVIDMRTRESYLTAKLYVIANRVKKTTTSSKNLLQALENDPSLLAIIPEKELFNKSTLEHYPLVEMEKNSDIKSKNKEFFKDINATFESILSMTE